MIITVFAENNSTGARRILGKIQTSKKDFEDFQERRNIKLYDRITSFHVSVKQDESLNYEEVK